MLDFTGVKAITIPEGSVAKITRKSDGVMLWEKPVAFKNYAEPLPNNTTDTTKWVNGYRFSSGGISAQAGTTLSNIIPITYGDVIRIKGVTLRNSADRWQFGFIQVGQTVETLAVGYYNTDYKAGAITYLKYNGYENGVYTYTVTPETWGHTPKSFRFAMPTPANANDVIITINQEIP